VKLLLRSGKVQTAAALLAKLIPQFPVIHEGTNAPPAKSKTGTFLVAGQFVPGYAEKLSSMLSHPSVKVLGHRKDVADLMRQSDLFVLPSIEEGSALVTSEARACGCVLVVSEATGAYCRHMENALVHRVGDVETLAQHLTLLHQDRALLTRLRSESLKTVHDITWRASGVRLREAYREIIEKKSVTLAPWSRCLQPLNPFESHAFLRSPALGHEILAHCRGAFPVA
jgi:glycosyltransferase involved in cell wall biosynthesis